MANTIITKNSATATAVPTAGQLVQGELAVNVTDKRLFTENSGGTVVELGVNPSSLTLSGGTANGVTYLNGSKVLTSGSALTFDGTNLGIEAASPAAKLHIGGNTASTQQAIFTTGVTDSAFKVVARNGVSGATAVQGYIGLDYASGTWPLLAGMQFIRNSTSGELAFTAGATTSASERMRLTSTGLGIGTSSPASKLEVASGNLTVSGDSITTVGQIDLIRRGILSSGAGVGIINFQGYSTGTTVQTGAKIQAEGAGTWTSTSTPANVLFYTTPSASTSPVERLRLDSSGNLGLGVTPSAWATLKPIQFAGGASVAGFSNTGYLNANAYFNGSWRYIATATSGRYEVAADHKWFSAASGTAGDVITFTQAMTLDASGNLLVGTTNSVIWNTTNVGVVIGGVSGSAIQVSRANDLTLLLNRLSSDGQIQAFARQGTQVGNISVTTSATSYNTSSDYRLKEDWQPMTGASERVKALNPVNFAWKVDGSRVDGFLAHEAAEVVPEAVSGAKDAVDADGNPDYQGIDQSKLVPLLTAALQEALAQIESLTARVSALEGN
jgi:hypothetical protein